MESDEIVLGYAKTESVARAMLEKEDNLRVIRAVAEELAGLAWQALAKPGAEALVLRQCRFGQTPESGFLEELLGVLEVDDDA